MKILVAFDNSPSGINALKFSTRFKDVCEMLTVLYVNPGMIRVASNVDSIVPEAVFGDQEQYNKEVEDSTKNILIDSGIKYEYVKIEATGDEVAGKIYNYAFSNGINFIITGSRKLSGFSKFILGSVSSEIIKLAKIPVMVVPPDEIKEE
jgi:nucleotide-binding universal stress UspA family protein